MFDIELQASEPSDGTLDLWTRYYLSTIDVDTERKGQDYDSLRHAFIILACAYDPLGVTHSAADAMRKPHLSLKTAPQEYF